MYERITLTSRTSYIDCPAKIGLFRVSDTDTVSVDSGSDKDAGKKILRALESTGERLTAVYNTHSHADHIGGNRFLQDKTGCAVYASGIECDFTNHPVLEPMLLWGGYPREALHHKFLQAQESRALPLTPDVLPEGLQLLPLPGHSFDMVGFRTSDDVVFLADCLSSQETLDKYGIGYLYDVEAYLSTLETVKTMEAAFFVPAHAAVTEGSIAPLAQYNIDAVRNAAETVVSFCAEPIVFEDILSRLFDAYQLTMTAQQYVLIGSTLRSYLSYLEKNGQISCFFDKNRMLWQKA